MGPVHTIVARPVARCAVRRYLDKAIDGSPVGGAVIHIDGEAPAAKVRFRGENNRHALRRQFETDS